MQTKLKLDLKRLANSELAANLSRHLKEYEAKVKEVVHGFDLKSRDAREKSRKRLDQFAHQLKKTRGELEKKVIHLANKEGERLNKKVVELVNYLKSVAGSEKITAQSVSPAKKKAAKGAGPKSRNAKKVSKKKSVAESAASASVPFSETSGTPTQLG